MSDIDAGLFLMTIVERRQMCKEYPAFATKGVKRCAFSTEENMVSSDSRKWENIWRQSVDM